MKKCIFMLSMVFVLSVLLTPQVSADTILFPYIASDGVNVTTIISVVNKSNSATHLTYIYRYKTGSAALDAGCTTQSFTRPTHTNDLVTFDVSGIFASGNAMYNDSDAYGGTFSLNPSTPIRGYLLVTHSDSTGARVDVSNSSISAGTRTLYGEAVLLDITSGAAWGYRAQNTRHRQDFLLPIGALHAGNEYFDGSHYKSGEGSPFTFFPKNVWTTKLFVTPISSEFTGDPDLSSDIATTIKLITAKDSSQPLLQDVDSCGSSPCTETEGVFSRSGTAVSKSSGLGGTLVKCIGAIDVYDLMDSTQRSQLENTGGWAILYGESASTSLHHRTYLNVFKLEYVLNNSTYGGTNNNAILITEEETP